MSNARRPLGQKTRDPRCKHNLVLCSQCVVITDAAKRMSDAIGLAILANPPEVTSRGFMAFALEDGTTDNVVYPSKDDAISHQSNEYRYCYVSLARCLGGAPPKDMQLWLDLHRHVYKQGGRLTDPASDIIMPLAREHQITVPVIPTLAEVRRNHWNRNAN